MRRISLLAGFPLLVAAACAPASSTAKSDSAAAAATAPDPAAVRAAIDAANAKFIDAFKKGDTATMAGNYTDDAVVMLPGQAAMHGHGEIARGMAAMLAAVTITDPRFTTSDVTIGGDLAVETGTYEMTLQEKGKKAMTDKGKYLTVWRKQPDGSWRIVRDINNSDIPPRM